MQNNPLEKISFTILTPEGIYKEGEAQQINIPGETGEFGILPGHTPLVASLNAGPVKLLLSDGTQLEVFVTGGFAEIEDNSLSIIADDIITPENISTDSLLEQIANYSDDILKQDDPQIIEDILFKQRKLEFTLANIKNSQQKTIK
jgi:F-type H+-transporting ATPase subunit epsilon